MLQIYTSIDSVWFGANGELFISTPDSLHWFKLFNRMNWLTHIHIRVDLAGLWTTVAANDAIQSMCTYLLRTYKQNKTENCTFGMWTSKNCVELIKIQCIPIVSLEHVSTKQGIPFDLAMNCYFWCIRVIYYNQEYRNSFEISPFDPNSRRLEIQFIPHKSKII